MNIYPLNIGSPWEKGLNWQISGMNILRQIFEQIKFKLLFLPNAKPHLVCPKNDKIANKRIGRNPACTNPFNNIISVEYSTRQTDMSCSCLTSKHIFLPPSRKLWHYLYIFNVRWSIIQRKSRALAYTMRMTMKRFFITLSAVVVINNR